MTEVQRAEMHAVLDEFPDVLSDKLGCTPLLKQDIQLTDETPIFSRPYKIPRSLEKPVQKEIDRE